MSEARDPSPLTFSGVLGWRADSQMLLRMRPIFAALLADAATVKCERDQTCRTSLRGSRGLWCPACRLQDLAARLQQATRSEEEKE